VHFITSPGGVGVLAYEANGIDEIAVIVYVHMWGGGNSDHPFVERYHFLGCDVMFLQNGSALQG
jgi:hypothetical protein